MKERQVWVDWAKTIAMYGVVLGHCTEPSNPVWVRNLSSFLISFHVPLFFLVSGYLFHVKEKKFVLFVKNSAKRLLIPYVFFNVVSAPILYKLQAQDVWVQGMYDFFLCRGHAWAGPAWFLVALFNIRLIAYGLLKIQKTWAWITFVSVIALVPCILPVRLCFGLSSAMIGLLFFEIGYWMNIRNYVSFYLRVDRYVMYAMPVILFVILKVFRPFDIGIDISRGIIGSPLSYILTIVAVGMALSFCILVENVKICLIETISRVSIVIMGFHMTIVQILWALKDRLPKMLYFTCESPFESVSAFMLSVFAGIIMIKYTPFLIGYRK